MFLSKILSLSCTIKHYIVMENILFYCLQCFSTVKISKRHVNDCFAVNGKQVFKTDKKDETVKRKTYSRKIKSHSSFMLILEVF